MSAPLRIAIICFINDPFDQIGGKRIGGGHLVLRELGEYLVSRGEDVTFITRLNSHDKKEYWEFGPRSRIFRISCGIKDELPPSQVGLMIDELEEKTRKIFHDSICDTQIIHSQYWIAGEVSRRINTKLKLKHIHYMLSFGRKKNQRKEQQAESDHLRDLCEINVFNSVDLLIAQCPSETSDLINLYPELNHKRIRIVPHGIDSTLFSPEL